jgi:phosphodiesterase/alkaline phosphatase D-like protein
VSASHSSTDVSPRLILGPIQRYVDQREATVWVETDRACEVEVLGHTARTFCVAGHHYALVMLEGLEPGQSHRYSVKLDGRVTWPEAGSPEGMIRTPSGDDEFRLAFGTCRVAVPHEPPYTHGPDRHFSKGKGVDSLRALQARMKSTPEDEWPQALMLIGDQVYADEVSPGVLRKIKERRDTSEGAGEEIADFEEYTWLYHESWGDEEIRWLLSSLPSMMIFDDHDVTDDWNTSGSWVRSQRQKGWWRERLIGAYMSYWIYQHLGNLSPGELREDATFAAVRENPGDAEPVLREFAGSAADEVAATRWSFHRDFGKTRLVALDTRAGRIVDDDSNREMLSDEQWRWMDGKLTGGFDHLLIASSLPLLMSPGIHHLQSWNEALCAGAWGKWAVRPSESLRRAVDLEHWPAFRSSFERLIDDIRAVGSGRRGDAPASVLLLSGDVHHAYVAEAEFPAGDRVESAVLQAVCSPMRNPLGFFERSFMKSALTKTGSGLARFLARRAKVPPPSVDWEFLEPPTFDNQIGTVEIDGREAVVRIEKTKPEDWHEPKLHLSLEVDVGDGHRTGD